MNVFFEMLMKNHEEWYPTCWVSVKQEQNWLTLNSTPQAFFVPSPLLKLSLITKKLAPMDEDLYDGDVRYNIHQLYSLMFEISANFFWILNFVLLCFDSKLFLWSEEPDVSPRRPISKRNTLKHFASLLG